MKVLSRLVPAAVPAAAVGASGRLTALGNILTVAGAAGGEGITAF